MLLALPSFVIFWNGEQTLFGALFVSLPLYLCATGIWNWIHVTTCITLLYCVFGCCFSAEFDKKNMKTKSFKECGENRNTNTYTHRYGHATRIRTVWSGEINQFMTFINWKFSQMTSKYFILIKRCKLFFEKKFLIKYFENFSIKLNVHFSKLNFPPHSIS